MRHFISVQIAMATIAVAICAFITACSSDKDKFSVDAHFLNMNMADFYVYSPDGAIDGVDTIHVQGGRFTYEHEIEEEGTIVIVFPNYAVMPIFVEPDADISIEANAAHLKAMEITGNDANEAFTEWRKQTDNMSEKEMQKQAEQFINDNLESPVSRWLVRQYFITAPSPDYKKANALLKKMLAATNNGKQVAKMMSDMTHARSLNIGDAVPHFSTVDINGKTVTDADLRQGNAIVLVWSTFNYESQNFIRQIVSRNQNGDNGEKKMDKIITICIEPDIKHCRRVIKECNAEELTTICDTALFDSPLLETLGFTAIPDDARFQDGKLKSRRVPIQDLFK